MLWAVLSLFCLVLASYPFTFYPLTLALVSKFKRRRLQPHADATPSFAICVPAFNEEQTIVAKAENLLLLQQTVPACQLLIYVDAATDGTAALLEPYRDRIDIVVGEVRRGKSHGLNLLVARTSADVLVFSDANVMLDTEALRRIGGWFSDPDVGCVCGHLRYGNGHESTTAAAGNLYWKIEESIRQLESDTVGVIGADGSLFATRRALHPMVPPDIIDDFYVSMKISLGGHAVVRAPDAFAYERTGSNEREEFERKVRIACQAFNVHRMLWQEIRKARFGLLYAYISHRLLKWLIIYNLGLSALFACFALIDWTGLQVASTITIATIAIAYVAWQLRIPPIRQLGSILVAFTGAGLGIFRSLRGDRFQTWKPMTTARVRVDVRP